VRDELAAVKPLKVGDPRLRDGVVRDRWHRDEAQVRKQLARAEEIAKCIAGCIAATPALEKGITLGGRQVQRLTVAERGFRRLAARDERILEEFARYPELLAAGALPASETAAAA
jgi:hypothetical protein